MANIECLPEEESKLNFINIKKATPDKVRKKQSARSMRDLKK